MSRFPVVDGEYFSQLLDAGLFERHKLMATIFDVNVVFDGVTLLHQALESEDVHLVTALLRFGADPNLRCGHRSIVPLGIAVNQGNAELIQILIAFGARTDYFKSELESISIEAEIERGNYSRGFKMKVASAQAS